MKRINKLLITTIFSAASSAHADFIPLDLLDSDLNDQSIYAGGGLTLGNSTVVGGNLQGASTVTTGVDTEVIVGGNIEAGTTATTGADSKVGGYIQAGTTVNTGVGSTVFGNIYSGTTTGTGATSTVKGSIEAGGLYSAGIGATVVGPISDNLASDPSYEAPTVKIQKTQLDAVQQTLNDLGTTLGSTSRDITFGVADETLTSGIYDSGNYLSIRAGITLTLDGENKDGDFLFNIHNYLEFAAGAKIELINFTDNSRVIWNAIGGYAQAAADVNIRGFIFAKGYVLTGARTTIKGVGSFCGGAFSVNDTVSFGADNIIGEQNCKVTNFLVAPDHFVISHDTSGIHCAAETVSVTAKNADGTTLTSYTGTITLDTQTGNGRWNLSSGSGTLTDGTADDGLATYAYAAGDNGVSTFALDYSEGTATFDIDAYDGAVRDDDTEGDITFAASGFTVTGSALSNPPQNPINLPIGTQTAGTAFNVYLAAYGTKATDSQCGIIETYTGNKIISLTTTHVNPSNVTLSATGGDAIAFTNGQAVVSTKYKDVGLIQLGASDGTISGNSNSFVVKPASFAIAPADSPFIATGPADSNIYTSAGTNFNITVTAKDSEGSTTPNYGNETSIETIALSHTLAKPVGGASGILSTSLNKTGSGIYSGTANWSEVGIINLIATVGDADYLGTGNVTTTLINVGRFIPASFEITATNGSLENTCTSPGLAPFSYIGQEFGYLITPSFMVTAKNALGTRTTTVNYRDDFIKLTNGSITSNTVTADTDPINSLGIFHNPASMSIPSDGKGDGIITYTFGDDKYRYGPDPTSLSYSKAANSEVSPFTANIDRYITDVTDGEVSTSFVSPGVHFDLFGNTLRFGRIKMSNIHGSELTALQMPMVVEYFTGSGYTQNADDNNCTQITTGDLTVTHNLRSSVTPTVSVTIQNSELGNHGVTLNPPGAGLDGNVVVSPNLDKWLRYDWDGNNLFDNDPVATGTFGIFKGDPVNIYMQQTYQ
jgi:hypothetical protein